MDGGGGYGTRRVDVSAVVQESIPPAYERRGDEVEATYTAFLDRLERYQVRLREALERDAPDLAARLRPDPPAAVAYGYQLLPTLTLGKAPASHQRPRSISYSWQRTQNIIDAQVARLARDEDTLDAAAQEAPTQRRDAYARLVDSLRDPGRQPDDRRPTPQAQSLLAAGDRQGRRALSPADPVA